jgi:Na+-transporting methylmalonyl-CoA/oxaloacetate decarboxylase gamma subunit
MLEIIVGMTVMAIFMTIFTTAVYAMSRTADKVDGITTTAGQTNQAFLKMDKLVRYAMAISSIGRSNSSNMWYVELETTANGPDVCTQLRVNTSKHQLQQRTWTLTGAAAGPASNWTMLADGVTNGTAAPGSATQPFSVPPAAATISSPYQQLTVTLVVTTGGATITTSKSHMTFTAINSLASATTNATRCQQKGRP